METLQYIWSTYGGWIMGFLGTGLGAAVVAFVARFVANLLARKLTGSLDVKKIVAEVTEQVTKNISGNVIDVDISAVVDASVRENLHELAETNRKTETTVSSLQKCVALMALAVSKSRLLDEGEQKALSAEASSLVDTAKVAEKQTTKVLLAPIAEKVQKEKKEKEEIGLDFDEVR